MRRSSKIIFTDDCRTFECTECGELLAGGEEVDKHKVNKHHRRYKLIMKETYYEI